MEKCKVCRKLNHFAVACREKSVSFITEQNDYVFDEDDEIFVYAIDNKNKNNNFDCTSKNKWFENIRIKNSIINIRLDTGCDVNILPLYLLQRIDKNAKINNTSTVLRAYGGQKIVPKGECELICMFGNTVSQERFVILNEHFPPILGSVTIEKFGLISRINSIENEDSELVSEKEKFIRKNKEIFEGIGKFPGKYKIVLKDGATPVANPPRRVPIKLKQKLKEALDDLERKKIISKVNGSRDWVHNLVIVEKADGTLRLCLNPKHLNKAIKKQQHLIPTFEEKTVDLEEAKFYTVLDIKQGFYQVELDEDSKPLVAFSTPFGIYEFDNMPFGLATASEVFQYKNE